MNNLDKQYTDLLQTILDYGVEKKDRTGTGTKSIFGYTIRHNMKNGFPLLTTKKMAWKTMVTELLWFLRGDTNIKFLVDNDCHIWDGDAYQAYLKKMDKQFPHILCFDKEEFINKIKTDDGFAKTWGELGPIYGKQWRNWGGKEVKVIDGKVVTVINDQITDLINELKTNPDSRRLMVSAWNVGEISEMVLPPCHYGFQVYTRELSLEERRLLVTQEMFNQIYNGGGPESLSHKEINQWNVPTRAISLMWNQRSVDTFLGLPFNIASYGLLLEILAKEVNMVPDELIGNLGDVHLYYNHLEQAKEQIGRDLTDEERYNIWFTNNYETGMERYFDPNKLPNFDDPYYKPTPKRTREPYPLPSVKILDAQVDDIAHYEIGDFELINYQYHPTIKAPLSN